MTIHIWPHGYTSDEQFTQGSTMDGQAPFDLEMVLRALDALKRAGAEGPYTCRLSVGQARQLRERSKPIDELILRTFLIVLVAGVGLQVIVNEHGVTVILAMMTSSDGATAHMHSIS